MPGFRDYFAAQAAATPLIRRFSFAEAPIFATYASLRLSRLMFRRLHRHQLRRFLMPLATSAS